MDAHTLLLSLAVAVEPLPVLATVVLLTTERGRMKALAFLVGWAVAYGGIALATLAVAGPTGTSSAGDTVSTAGALADVALGLVLAVVAIRRRPGRASGGPATTPGWLSRLDRTPPVAALGLGLFLPPYAVAVAVGSSVASTSSGAGAVAAVLACTAIACGGVVVPLLLAVARPATAEAVLAGWRGWLVANWSRVAFWLVAGLAAYLVARGVVALVGAG